MTPDSYQPCFCLSYAFLLLIWLQDISRWHQVGTMRSEMRMDAEFRGIAFVCGRYGCGNALMIDSH